VYYKCPNNDNDNDDDNDSRVAVGLLTRLRLHYHVRLMFMQLGQTQLGFVSQSHRPAESGWLLVTMVIHTVSQLITLFVLMWLIRVYLAILHRSVGCVISRSTNQSAI